MLPARLNLELLLLVGAGALAGRLRHERIQTRRLTGELAGARQGRKRQAARAQYAASQASQRWAERVHNDVMPGVLAARQDLDEIITGQSNRAPLAASALDAVLNALRGEVCDRHPHALHQMGLGAVLTALAQRAAQRGGFETTLAIDPKAADKYDEVVHDLAREFLDNAAKHAHPSQVTLSLDLDGEHFQLEVCDDGIGFDNPRLASAQRDGHIGLSSQMENVESHEGQLAIHSTPSRGTTIVATVPVNREQRRVSRAAVRVIDKPKAQPLEMQTA